MNNHDKLIDLLDLLYGSKNNNFRLSSYKDGNIFCVQFMSKSPLDNKEYYPVCRGASSEEACSKAIDHLRKQAQTTFDGLAAQVQILQIIYPDLQFPNQQETQTEK